MARRSPDFLQAPIDPPDPTCTLCDGDGWVGHPYDMTREEPCECRNGDYPDERDREADRACRKYHEQVDQGMH